MFLFVNCYINMCNLFLLYCDNFIIFKNCLSFIFIIIIYIFVVESNIDFYIFFIIYVGNCLFNLDEKVIKLVLFRNLN